jgi:hypothetical protein
VTTRPCALTTTLLMAAAVVGCDRSDLYGGNTFTENVQAAYAECSEAEIRFLASKNGIQTAFENCGSNRFSMFSWSPDGRFLYFELTTGGYVLDGQDKTITSLPTPPPASNAVWVRSDLLVIPLGPKDPGEDVRAPEAPATPDAAPSLPADAARPGAPATPENKVLRLNSDVTGPTRLVSWDRAQGAVAVVAVDLHEPRDLQRWTDDTHVLLSAVGSDGLRLAYTVDLTTGAASRAFPYVKEPLANFSYNPTSALLGWSDGTDTVLYATSTETMIADLPGVTRAVPHPGGRYVGLETTGQAVSPFDQRSWDELSPDARERELKRQGEWLKNQPDWVPRELNPPEVQVLDLLANKRYRVTYLQGDHFEWYPARDYYYSVVMWGIEGKQVNRNVVLADLRERLRMADQGDLALGLAAWNPSGASPSPQVGADAAETEAQPAPVNDAQPAASPSAPPAVAPVAAPPG